MNARQRWGRPLHASIAVVVGLVFLSPVLWMLAASLKPDEAVHEHVESLRSFIPAPFTFENYAAVADRANFATVLVNTLIMVGLVAGGGLLINGPAAFAFARMRFPGRDLIFMVLIASIVLPFEVIVVPLFMTVGTLSTPAEALGQRAWVLLALSVPFMAKAFNIFLLRQYFLSLPASLQEAAFLDGLGWWGVYWRVALPNIKPAIITVVLLDFVIHWNDFLWALVVCRGEDTRTIQLGLGNFFTQPPISWGAIMAYAALATLPIALVFAFGQRWVVRSVASTGTTG
jgi:ABC-type glycerol-3-phosphate transport system permease component